MDANELKEYIINNNQIDKVMEGLGCHSIREHSTEYRGALPDGTNSTAVSIKKDNLGGRIYTDSETVSGDILTVAMSILGVGFRDVMIKVHGILGLTMNAVSSRPKKKKCNPLDIFTNACRRVQYESDELKAYDISELDRENFLSLPTYELFQECIIPSIQEEFSVKFDMRTRRIIFPHFKWDTGELIGIMGRTTVEGYDVLQIPKYFPIIPHPKSLNLYGLYQNYNEIQKLGCVIVVEGEKSVLKMKSLGYPNVVALSGHAMSSEQAKILISLDVDIIIALDKGLDESVSIDMCNRINNYRTTHYLFDKWGITEDKDAPIDKGCQIFEHILKYKVRC